MNKTEEEYLKPINILSDFNSRTGILATQMSALKDAIYSPALGSLANGLLNEYKSFSPIADLLPKIDISIGSSLTGIAREANLVISSLTNNENVLALGSIVSERPHSWLNGIDSIHSLSPISGIAQTIAQSVGAVDLPPLRRHHEGHRFPHRLCRGGPHHRPPERAEYFP